MVVTVATDSSCALAATANVDDGACTYDVYGCADPTALNFDSMARCTFIRCNSRCSTAVTIRTVYYTRPPP